MGGLSHGRHCRANFGLAVTPTSVDLGLIVEGKDYRMKVSINIRHRPVSQVDCACQEKHPRYRLPEFNDVEWLLSKLKEDLN